MLKKKGLKASDCTHWSTHFFFVGLVHTRAPQADLRPWHEKMGWWKRMLFAKTLASTQQSTDNERDNEPRCSNNSSPRPLVYHLLERFMQHHNSQLLLFTCPLCGEQHSFAKCQRQKEKENQKKKKSWNLTRISPERPSAAQKIAAAIVCLGWIQVWLMCTWVSAKSWMMEKTLMWSILYTRFGANVLFYVFTLFHAFLHQFQMFILCSHTITLPRTRRHNI